MSAGESRNDVGRHSIVDSASAKIPIAQTLIEFYMYMYKGTVVRQKLPETLILCGGPVCIGILKSAL